VDLKVLGITPLGDETAWVSTHRGDEGWRLRLVVVSGYGQPVGVALEDISHAVGLL
jgi:hypothetical protein